MRVMDFRALWRRFVRSEAGSLQISAALFVIALVCACVMAILGATGVLQVPRLIYLVFAVAVVAAGWDAWREWRKSGRD
jgi:protein-S-isoprenylcysteine O-methyltransferase Ste14